MSPDTMSPVVIVRDVTLRDGLQSEPPIATDVKVEIAAHLARAGVRELELTSFVRPDRVPALADAAELVARTADLDLVRWGLVLNLKGAERALASGLRHLQFVLSVSEPHNLGNAGRTVAASLSDLEALLAVAAPAGASVELTLATAFGCPHEGVVAPERVVELADIAGRLGVAGIGLADTIGTAVPPEVTVLVGAVVEAVPGLPVGLHLHDTRGLAVANALAGLAAGAVRLDAALGSLGGCPFAPGATGNLAIEDLVHCLEESGLRTGIDLAGLLAASSLACASVGRPVGSHVGAAGPRFTTPAPTPG